MAGISIGPFTFGGDGTSAEPQTQEYYKNFADGTTHLIRQQVTNTNGKIAFTGNPEDMGAVASKAPPTDHAVVKTLNDGSTWAYAFNPDGTVKASTQLSDAQGKPVDPALEGQRDATTRLIDQKLAEAEAIAPYSIDKAQATIANLNARTSLTPDQKALIDARVTRIASQNSVDPSRIGLNNANAGKAVATTAKLDAQTQALLQKNWASFEPQRQAIIAAHTNGELTDDQFKQAMDNVTKEAITGLTAQQQQDEAYRQGVLQKDRDTNAVNQGNNRATAAASYFDRAGTTAMDAAKGGASGSAAAGGFLAMLHMAPQFQDSMGGAPVQGLQATPQAANATFTLDHAKQIAQLVTSGQAPPDANGNRVPAAVQMAGQQAGVLPPDPSASIVNYAPGQGRSVDNSGQSTTFLPDVANNPTLAAAGSGGL